MYRFLQRVWRNLIDEETGASRVIDDSPADDLVRLLHKTIEGVRADMEAMRFNTSIAKLIELNNRLTAVAAALGGTPRTIAEPFVLLLAPLAPHVAEELWASFGATTSLAEVPFPVADQTLLVEDTVELPVSINGKVRARITVASDADESTVREAALAEPNVLAHLGGAAPKKLIVVPGRMVNIVV
jgi:leucyl-tRNA synthetase